MAHSGAWRRDPNAPFAILQGELHRLFDQYWNPIQSGPLRTAPEDVETAAWSPPIDLIETPEAYVLLAEVPGIDPPDIDLSITGNILTLRGVKGEDGSFEGLSSKRERVFGPFHRQVVLPGEVDFDSTRASANNGVLKIVLPRRQSTKPRVIPVEKR